MESKVCKWILSTVAVLSLCGATGALAQAPVRLTGQLHDETPSSVKDGPWEMNALWSLDFRPGANRADFSADMTMADIAITPNGIGPTQPGQNRHTRQIKLTNAKVTWNMNGCPAYSPATKIDFQINGEVSLLMGNGGIAPFETPPPSSTLQVCITGGTGAAYAMPYSNITLVFGGPATTHFGSQAFTAWSAA